MVHQCCLKKKKPKGLLIIYIGPEVLITKSVYCIKCDCYMYMYTGVLSMWVLIKLLGKSLNDWVISMLLYEKYLMLSVFFPIITSQIMPLTFKIVHPVSTSTVRLSVLCWQLSSISILLLICPTIIQLLINYVLCQKK